MTIKCSTINGETKSILNVINKDSGINMMIVRRNDRKYRIGLSLSIFYCPESTEMQCGDHKQRA